MRSLRVGIAVFAWTWAATAAAQVVPANYWARGTELAVATGAATSASTTGPLLGATARWDVTRWVGVEGRATWFDRGVDATAFGADLSGIVNLVPKQAVTPFVGAGFGFYRASFQSAGAPMSSFYALRLGSPIIGSTNVFTDPALRLTAGVDLVGQTRRRHWTVRPEVSTLLVHASGRGESVVSGTVSVGYRFRGAER